MTRDNYGVAVTPPYPLSRSPEDQDAPRETGSTSSRTKSSPTHNSASSGPNPSAVRYQRQPPAPLDTISAGVASKPSASRTSSDSSNNTEPVSDSNSSHKQTMVQSRSSPRSVDNNNEMSQKHGSRSGSSQADPPTQIQFGSHGSMVVPSTIIGPPPRAPSPMNNTMAGMQMDPNHPFANNNNKNGRDSHRRAESWSGNFPPMGPPSPAGMGFQFGPGAPMHPFTLSDPQMMSTETSSLLGNAAPLSHSIRSSSNQRKRKPGNGSHRRCLSSGSGYAGMYGGGSVHSFDMPPPPPPPRQEQFSPRDEFMKLTSSFRGTPPSPSGRKMSPMNGFSVSPQGTPRHVRSNSNGRVSFSPHNLPPPSPGHGGHGYGAINVTNTSVPDFPMTSQGEAVFMAQKCSSGRHSHRGESTRKRHMRQQSAQLYMEETKGLEQPPACRDVVFLLLFLFHIVGIVFLGNTYGPMALNDDSDHVASTSGGLAEEGTGDQVHLYYYNLVFIAGASGLFAIGLSTLALGLMAVIARRFVQVALCLAVTISFAWGTIGTGYSPKNVVPITGFIALALSVAYTFIVWDRIPFCSANLLTALSGIKANLSTLMVALFFQAASLGYCVYYTLVVVGVYDAIQEEKLLLSPKMQTVAYIMLAVSFYWTYNVILVSSIYLFIASLAILHFSSY